MPIKQTFSDSITLQAATNPVTIVGTAVVVATVEDAVVFCDHALVENTANTNAGVFKIQGSPDASGNRWTDMATNTAATGTAVTEAFTATEPIGETVCAVASTTGFTGEVDVYVINTTLANSEWAFTQEISADASITLIDGLEGEQTAAASSFWNLSEHFVDSISCLGLRRLRVVFTHEGATAANAHVRASIMISDKWTELDRVEHPV